MHVRRHSAVSVAAVFLTVFVACVGAHAQSLTTESASSASERFEADVARVQALWDALRFDQSALLAGELLVRGEALFGADSPRLLGILELASALAWERGDHPLAEARVRRMLQISRATLGRDHPRIVELLSHLAKFQETGGDREEADATLREALELATRVGDDLVTARLLTQIARFVEDAGKRSRAEQRYREALALIERHPSQDDSLRGAILRELAGVVGRQGRSDEALLLAQQATSVLDRIARPNSQQRTYRLEARVTFGNLLAKKGRRAEAEREYLKVLRTPPSANSAEDTPIISAATGLAEIRLEFDVRRGNEPLYAAPGRFLGGVIAEGQGHYGKFFLSHWTLVARMLIAVGDLYALEYREAKSNPYFERALQLYEEIDQLQDAHSLEDLLRLSRGLTGLDRPIEAERALQRAGAIADQAVDRAAAWNRSVVSLNLAMVYLKTGRFAEAEAAARRALSIRERDDVPKPPGQKGRLGLADSVLVLGGTLFRQRRYAEAEPLVRRALGLREAVLPADHPMVLDAQYTLASTLQRVGRYREAEELGLELLARLESAPEARQQGLVDLVWKLGSKALHHYRLAEGELLFKRLLAVMERLNGPDHPDTVKAAFNLSSAYAFQHRFTEAEVLARRTVAALERRYGRDHTEVAWHLQQQAVLLESMGELEEAETLLLRAVAIQEQAGEAEWDHLEKSLKTLADVHEKTGRRENAGKLRARAATIRDRLRQRNGDPETSRLFREARASEHAGDFAKAEQILKRIPPLWDPPNKITDDNGSVVISRIAEVQFQQGREREAVETMRLSVDYTRREAVGDASRRSLGFRSAAHLNRIGFVGFIDFISRVLPKAPDAGDLVAESFEVGQLARRNSTAATLAQMASRFARRDDALGRIVRDRQDAYSHWQALDEALAKVLAMPPERRDAAELTHISGEITGVERRLRRLDDRLDTEFPEYRELASPRPLTLSSLQRLLGPKEALITYLSWDYRTVDYLEDVTFLWVVRSHRAALIRVPVGREALEKAVARLRYRLDPTNISQLNDLFELDLAGAHRLYQLLVEPAVPLLHGADHLFVVPEGPLHSLPFAALLTEPVESRPREFAVYRKAAWLARKFAVTVLPSVSSLRALRRLARASTASKPFLGIGDPVLRDHPGPTESESDGLRAAPARTWLSSQRGRTAIPSLYRGTKADVEVLRQLDSLPETAGELASMARSLGSGPEHLYLRERAVELTLKNIDLSQYRILAFATHGIVGGELRGVAEPALVLTPPTQASATNDGLLTASEIAQLKIDADWVILSACNTAAPDGRPDAEGLSGLAKGFFYAGSRGLLVSHWPVASSASVKLTTGMIREMVEHPDIGGAEAHRRSMLALMMDPEEAMFAHPLFWAPFVVVGAGGAQHNSQK